LILFIATGSSGCATAITQGLRDSARSPDKEIGSDSTLLLAAYLGDTTQDGVTIARIVVSEPRSGCGDRPPIELLLPLTRKRSARPRLVEGERSAAPEGQPVRIVIDYEPSWSSRAPDSEQPRWDGYPSVIRLHRVGGLEVSYRFGADEPDLRRDSMEVGPDWVCRSHVQYAGLTALLPVAVAFDIATFPVYLILTLLGGP